MFAYKVQIIKPQEKHVHEQIAVEMLWTEKDGFVNPVCCIQTYGKISHLTVIEQTQLLKLGVLNSLVRFEKLTAIAQRLMCGVVR